MYKIGMVVSYGLEGVCTITQIKQQKFGKSDDPKDFYVLSPINDPISKIYVPLDNEILVSKMRLLCSADEINALAEALCDKTMEWIKESRQRSHTFRAIISECKIEKLILLIKTISMQEQILFTQGKHLTQGDELVLKKAQNILVGEFSITTNISNEEILMDVIFCKTKCESK